MVMIIMEFVKQVDIMPKNNWFILTFVIIHKNDFILGFFVHFRYCFISLLIFTRRFGAK